MHIRWTVAFSIVAGVPGRSDVCCQVWSTDTFQRDQSRTSGGSVVEKTAADMQLNSAIGSSHRGTCSGVWGAVDGKEGRGFRGLPSADPNPENGKARENSHVCMHCTCESLSGARKDEPYMYMHSVVLNVETTGNLTPRLL